MKKLQVFISSTYSDLLEERQACVETVLSSGHIPAGMELFAAGSESQLETIKRWIDNCDVYMLLLGGRYGSIEPKSKLSYTEVEYRYAVLEKKKPFFAIVMADEFLNEKVRKDGLDVFERKNNEKYDKFKKLVKSKTVKEFGSLDGIKAAVIQSMFDIQNRYDLKGWVKGDEVIDVKPLIKQIDILSQENAELKLQLRNMNKRKPSESKSKRSLKQFEFEGTAYIVEHWRDMLTKILDILAESKKLRDPDVLFALNSRRALFFTFDEKRVSRPYKIPLTKIYLGTHHSPDSFQRLAKAVVTAVGLPES